MIWKTIFVVVLAVGTLAQTSIRDMCQFYGFENKTDEVTKKLRDTSQCINNLINVEALMKEINEAVPTSSIREVFKKHCPKSPQLKNCIHEYYAATSSCQMQFFRDNLPAAYNATDKIIDYICYNDGERVASFIAGGGLQCVEGKSNELQVCVNILKSSVSLPALSRWNRQRHCRVFDEVRDCVAITLESCPTPAALNMAQALFAMASKGHICTDLTGTSE